MQDRMCECEVMNQTRKISVLPLRMSSDNDTRIKSAVPRELERVDGEAENQIAKVGATETAAAAAKG
jgi:hypothetical protein